MDQRYIPPSIRLHVLVRDGFACVYCGAKRSDGHELEIDHVIPVSAGGTSHQDNLVAACKPCNRGKAGRQIVSVQAGDQDAGVFQPADEFGSVPAKAARDPDAAQPLAAWVPKFQEHWSSVEVLPGGIDVPTMCDDEPSVLFRPSMVCHGRDNSDIGSHVRVLVVPWKEIGGFSLEEQEQITNAVISGYRVPTIILMGTPSLFFGVVVNERYKGTPRGRIVSHFLEPLGYWHNFDWYPDEELDFKDLREPYRQSPGLCHVIDFDDTTGSITGIYASFDGMGVWNGL
jgi:hypothetical protein